MADGRRVSSSTINLINSLLVIAIFAGGWLFVKPQYDEWKALRPQARSVETQLDSKQKTLDQVNGLLSTHKSLSDQLEVLDEALPSSPKVPQLLSNIEELVIISGLQIQELKITEPTRQDLDNTANNADNPLADLSIAGAPQLVPIKINLSVRGPVELFDPFMRAVENNLRLLEIELLSVDSSDEGQPVYEFVIETLYQR